MDQIKQQILTFLRQYKYIALILAVGLVLMLLPEGGTREQVPVQTTAQTASDPEERLEAILSQIQGVGKVRVLLTVARGERTVYIYDEDHSISGESDSSRKEVVVITEGDRSQKGLVSQVLSPTYLGAIVVCQGGDQPSVRLAVVEAVCNATGLTADTVSVMKMK